MNKEDLKSGMIVKLYENSYWMVIRNTGTEEFGEDYGDNDVLVGINIHTDSFLFKWMPLSIYQDDLECKEDKTYSIVEIFAVDHAIDLGKFSEYSSLWKKFD